ncbi:hypothetical protein BJ138DRAFT_1235200, partial [Hygrophoropsis aurantiaca]
MIPDTLRLNCLVIGQPVNNIFEVKVTAVDTVAYLRKAIKHEKPLTFHNVEADSLELWSVSLPNDDALEQNLINLNSNLNPKQSLHRRPMTKLRKVLPDPLEDEHLHIIVRPPPGAAGKLSV